MSRAFVNEDAGADPPPPKYDLPLREDPDFPRAAARALLEGARIGDTLSAEEATGHSWGDPTLVSLIREMLISAEREGDERLAQVAERYIKHSTK